MTLISILTSVIISILISVTVVITDITQFKSTNKVLSYSVLIAGTTCCITFNFFKECKYKIFL
ncbi:hypothetical protein F3I01_12925 [Bacillus sp. SRB1LM]|nr:hypothetical protein [Bacillus sp. SRB1LM]